MSDNTLAELLDEDEEVVNSKIVDDIEICFTNKRFIGFNHVSGKKEVIPLKNIETAEVGRGGSLNFLLKSLGVFLAFTWFFWFMFGLISILILLVPILLYLNKRRKSVIRFRGNGHPFDKINKKYFGLAFPKDSYNDLKLFIKSLKNHINR